MFSLDRASPVPLATQQACVPGVQYVPPLHVTPGSAVDPEQVTATLVIGPDVTVPLAAERLHVWPAGCVPTVTAYPLPLAT